MCRSTTEQLRGGCRSASFPRHTRRNVPSHFLEAWRNPGRDQEVLSFTLGPSPGSDHGCKRVSSSSDSSLSSGGRFSAIRAPNNHADGRRPRSSRRSVVRRRSCPRPRLIRIRSSPPKQPGGGSPGATSSRCSAGLTPEAGRARSGGSCAGRGSTCRASPAGGSSVVRGHRAKRAGVAARNRGGRAWGRSRRRV